MWGRCVVLDAVHWVGAVIHDVEGSYMQLQIYCCPNILFPICEDKGIFEAKRILWLNFQVHERIPVSKHSFRHIFRRFGTAKET